MNQLTSIITPAIIQREFLRLIGESNTRLVSVKIRPEADYLAADVEIKGQCFEMHFEAEALRESLDDFSDHYIAPAIKILNLSKDAI